MKKNIFPFILDANLIADIDCLLKLLRQALPLDELFKKFSSDILKARLDQLEFKSENRRSTEYFVITFKDKNNNTIELTNNDLSYLGITITDHAHLINPLINLQKTFPALNLKDALTNLITTNNEKNNQIKIDEIINVSKSKALNDLDNKNKQIEINIFFNFLKKLIVQQNDNFSSKFSFPIQAQTLIDLASPKIINWLISDNKANIFEPRIYYSKKYNEIDGLIGKLFFLSDTSYLAKQLKNLNNHCLQKLLNLNQIGEAIEIIENFQCEAKKAINEFRKNNSLSLESLNILHKLLNAIAKLVPNFIIQKKTRIGFFQQYTPQNKLLVKLEKAIQPVQPNF